jgi:hypothetical protein
LYSVLLIQQVNFQSPAEPSQLYPDSYRDELSTSSFLPAVVSSAAPLFLPSFGGAGGGCFPRTPHPGFYPPNDGTGMRRGMKKQSQVMLYGFLGSKSS